MNGRLHQTLLVVSLLWLSWLLMMLVHESGHALGALCTGGHVLRLVFHPTVLSRTEVRPNPHPLVEVWAGPIFGSLFPLSMAAIVAMLRLRIAYLIGVVAGFCLIANGAYIGVGAFAPVCDAKELIAHGMPRWSMTAFGIMAVLGGFWIWNAVSPKLGFGRSPQPVDKRHAYGTLAVAVIVTTAGFAFGDRGN